MSARNTLIIIIAAVGAIVVLLSRGGNSNDPVYVESGDNSANNNNNDHSERDSRGRVIDEGAAAQKENINDLKTPTAGDVTKPPATSVDKSPASAAAVPAEVIPTVPQSSMQPAGATREISYSDLLPWKGDPTNVCCRTLREASTALLGVPSDIGLLLPILGAYFKEEDMKTVVELGSRLGSSSMTMLRMMSYEPTKRFSTVDLEIRQPVRAMYQCEKKCTEASGLKGKRDFFHVEGNDLEIKIPFVTSQNEDQRPIDLLFIDTLHNAALLDMELRRYPKYVRKYIVFHDSYSFRMRNEGPAGFKPPGWPRGKKIPVGLQVVIREFLIEHGDEWVEEMNNVHNNGFFVIRRRSVPVSRWVLSEKPRYSGIKMEGGDGVIDKLLGFPRLAESPEIKCNRAYDEMYAHLGINKERISPPCHVAGGFSLRNHLTPLYNLLIAQPDDALPIAPLLPVIASQVTAPLTVDGESEVVVVGCEVSVVNAAMHGALQARKTSVRFVPVRGFGEGKECKSSDRVTKYVTKNDAVLETSLPSQRRSVDVLVIAADILASLTSEEVTKLAETVRHRLVAYGTSLYSVRHAATAFSVVEVQGEAAVNNKEMIKNSSPDAFELKLGLGEGVGMAMWERRNSNKFLYVPQAKKVE